MIFTWLNILMIWKWEQEEDSNMVQVLNFWLIIKIIYFKSHISLKFWLKNFLSLWSWALLDTGPWILWLISPPSLDVKYGKQGPCGPIPMQIPMGIGLLPDIFQIPMGKGLLPDIFQIPMGKGLLPDIFQRAGFTCTWIPRLMNRPRVHIS